MASTAYSATRIFTGEEWLQDHAVIVENGIIQTLVSAGSLPSGILRKDFGEAIITPAFIDLQIYGAYGKLLAVYPETDALHKLNEYCRSGGTAWCLPTLATNTYEVFYRGIDAVREYWRQGGEGILGLHIEGPWINPLKKGAHIASLIHSPSLDQVRELLEYGKDVIRFITLAPEVCSPEVVACILSYNIIISAGHSDASYTQAKEGFAQGISAVTHLYNAMSPLQHRAPGLVGAALDDDKVMVSIIPDGYHVDYAAIRIAKAAAGNRLFVITDAVTETGHGPYPHQLAGDKYESNGILSGSALKTNQAVRNLVRHAGIELGEALRMCSLYPAELAKMEGITGRIAGGHSAKMAVLNPALDLIELISH